MFAETCCLFGTSNISLPRLFGGSIRSFVHAPHVPKDLFLPTHLCWNIDCFDSFTVWGFKMFLRPHPHVPDVLLLPTRVVRLSKCFAPLNGWGFKTCLLPRPRCAQRVFFAETCLFDSASVWLPRTRGVSKHSFARRPITCPTRCFLPKRLL